MGSRKRRPFDAVPSSSATTAFFFSSCASSDGTCLSAATLASPEQDAVTRSDVPIERKCTLKIPFVELEMPDPRGYGRRLLDTCFSSTVRPPLVRGRYLAYGTDEEEPGRQIWHTPTELFKVCAMSENLSNIVINAHAWLYYGQAVTQCLVSPYHLKYLPYEDLVIQETGAKNGTFAMDINITKYLSLGSARIGPVFLPNDGGHRASSVPSFSFDPFISCRSTLPTT